MHLLLRNNAMTKIYIYIYIYIFSLYLNFHLQLLSFLIYLENPKGGLWYNGKNLFSVVPPFFFKGPFEYNLFLLKTKKYCSKIIFKCVNSTVGPIFNKKIAKK